MQTNAMATPSAAMDIANGGTSILPGDVDAMLAAILPQAMPASAADSQNRRKISRFRVKWNVDLLIEGHTIHHGFINDISMTGASVYLSCNMHPLKPTLRIHVPPLSPLSGPRFIEVSGKTVYVVYDGEKQLYRAAISFTRFRAETDRAYLEERLNKHHPRIPEH